MRQRIERYIVSLIVRNKEEEQERGSVTTNTDDSYSEREAMEQTELSEAVESDTSLDTLSDASSPQAREPLPETATLSDSAGLGERRQARPAKEPRLEIASRCHIGRVRSRNEDTSLTFVSQAGGTDPLPLFGLFIVADGMGGHNDGHRASRLVARTVAQHIFTRLYASLLQEGPTVQQPVQEAMEEAVTLANKALAGAETGKEMGTTLTAAVILGSRLFLVHIGDSRAYLMHEGQLSLVTTDHTFVQALQDAGQLTAEEAAIHPSRNLLYRALMGEAMEEPVDVFTRSLPQRGCLMLCSDGLWDAVSEQTIASILGDEIGLQEKAERLLEAALKAGGSDNITVILASFEF